MLVPGISLAQSASKPNVSPASPPTLKAPVFDTTKPVYNPPNAKNAADTVVAVVDGRPISLGEVADAIKDLPAGMQNMSYEDLFAAAQRRLIAKVGLAIAAQELKLDADPDVKRRLKEASDEVLATAYLRHQADTDISEQTLLDRYAKEFAGKPGPEQVDLDVIAVSTEAAANDILKRLQSGADFAALAKSTSEDPTASAGGKLGWVTRTDLNPELAGIVFAIPPGQVVPSPVKSNGKWFVIKIAGRRNQASPPYGEVRDRLRKEIVDERAADWTQKVLAGRTIRVFTIAGREVEDLPPPDAAPK